MSDVKTDQWSLAWGDNRWGPDDLTGRHLALIGIGLGEDTFDFDPRGGPRRLLAVLGAFISIHTDLPYMEAIANLQTLPAHELLATLVPE